MSQYSTDMFRTSCGAAAPLELNVSRPGGAGRERRVFEQPFVLVGRHENTSLHLEDPEVLRRHAYLQQFGERVFCVDLGSRTGIRWAGESRPSGWLRPDQGIQIGSFTLELAMAAQAGGGPGEEVAAEWDPLQDRVNDARLLPWITAERDNTVLAQMRMNRALVLVGSSPACRIRLPGAGVSWYHCSLVRTSEGIWMIDLLNETGTCLNGQPTRWALVKEGDQLQVGPYALCVRYQNAHTATPPYRLWENRAEALVQSAAETSKQGELPVQPSNILTQTLAVSPAEQSATEVSSLVPALQAELDQTRERLRETEVFRQQLADSQAECVRLRDQVRVIEIHVAAAASLQDRLEAAHATARELEAVCAEREQWQAEAQTLQNRLASLSADQEQLDRLAADLHAAHVERDRLHTEQQASVHLAEQERARVSDLERALTEATAAHERDVAEARGRWESEWQTLEVRLEQERQAHSGGIQAAVREVQIRAEAAVRDIQMRTAAEREEWRKRLEGAEAQIVWERELFQEQGEQIRRQVAVLQTERDRLATRLAEAELLLRAADERAQNDPDHAAEREQLRQLAIRDQVFSEFGFQMRHLLGQSARKRSQDKPTEQSPSHTA